VSECVTSRAYTNVFACACQPISAREASGARTRTDGDVLRKERIDRDAEAMLVHGKSVARKQQRVGVGGVCCELRVASCGRVSEERK
jgi:hypothetical protein